MLFNFNPINPTGHYELRFEVPHERAIIQRLAEIAEAQKLERQLAGKIAPSLLVSRPCPLPPRVSPLPFPSSCLTLALSLLVS